MKKGSVSFTDVMTTSEAAKKWDIAQFHVFCACTGVKGREPRLLRDVECRQSFKTWLVTRAGMERLYGPAKFDVEENLQNNTPTTLKTTFTSQEAANLWGISKECVKRAASGQFGGSQNRTPPRLLLGVECRRANKVWLITFKAMERLYGSMVNK